MSDVPREKRNELRQNLDPAWKTVISEHTMRGLLDMADRAEAAEASVTELKSIWTANEEFQATVSGIMKCGHASLCFTPKEGTLSGAVLFRKDPATHGYCEACRVRAETFAECERIAREFVGGYSANVRVNLSEQELVKDKDGPWVLNSDIADAIAARRQRAQVGGEGVK